MATPLGYAGIVDLVFGWCCRYVASGPLVRSSYKAGELFMESMLREKKKEKRSRLDAGLQLA